MRRPSRRTLRPTVAAILTAVVAAAVLAPSAHAATWTRTASTTHNAYSVDGYKAKVYPYKASTPAGYTPASRVMTVYNSAGTKVASGVGSKWLGPGTYSAYSKSTFRQPYTTTVTQTYTVTSTPVPYSCRVTSSEYQDAADALLVAVTCNAYDDRKTKFVVSAVGYAPSWGDGSYEAGTSVSGYSAVEDWLWSTDYYDYDGHESLRSEVYQAAEAKIGTQATSTITKTLYRYKYSHTKRTVYVKKVYNPPTASWAEYQAIKVEFWDGIDSLARVRAIIGSNGTRTYFSDSDGQTLSTYEWKNSSGGTVTVSFDDGRAYTKSWWS